MVMGESAPLFERVTPPLLDEHVTRYPTMASPPSPLEAKRTVAELFPRVTPVIVGAAGASPATKDADVSEGALSPYEFVATTLHV